MDDRDSIFSHGERAVARHLRADPGATPAAIAAERSTDAAAVEAAIERIREKTGRAVATLAQSPFAGEVAAGMDPETLGDVVRALEGAAGDVARGADDPGVVDPPLGGRVIERGLAAPFRVEYHDRIASTNDRARDLAAAGEADVAVLADEQTGGRGRRGRWWVGPSGGVWLSVLVDPALPDADVPVLTLAGGVAVARAAREVGVDAGIKWPNDVLVPVGGGDEEESEGDGSSRDEEGESEGAGSSRDERKLAGVLTERVEDRVVVGIGVNANVSSGDLPGSATSLRAAVGDVDRRGFVRRLLEEFDDLRGDPEATLAAWRDMALTLGRRVRIETPAGEVIGEAVAVERPGRLVVETEAGTVRVDAGDCEHLRPV